MKNGIIVFITSLIFIVSVFFMYKYKKLRSTISPSKTFIVGTNAEYPPFCSVENGNIVGFDIDIAKDIAKRLGKEIIIKDMAFEALIPELQIGKIHFAAAGLTPTPEKAKKVLFTEPYLKGDPLLIICPKEKKGIGSVNDLKNKTVIVNSGYTADLYMSKYDEISLLRLANPAMSFLALNSGKADAFVSAKSAVKPFFDKHGVENYSITPIEGTEETYAIVVSKKHKKMFKAIQDSIREMLENGTIKDFKHKWDIK